MSVFIIRCSVAFLARRLMPYSCTHCGRPTEYCVCGRTVTR